MKIPVICDPWAAPTPVYHGFSLVTGVDMIDLIGPGRRQLQSASIQKRICSPPERRENMQCWGYYAATAWNH